MTQTVNVPGIGQLNFPDGMSQSDMAAAIQRNFPQLQQQSSTSLAAPVSEGKAQGQRMAAQLQDMASHPGQALGDLATKGLGEVALSAVTGIGSSIAGGFRGLAKLATGGSVDDAAQVIRDTQEKYTYQPKTTVGKFGNEMLSLPINVAKSAASEIGGDIGQAVGGLQGRVAGESIGHALPDVAATLAGGRAAMKPRAPMPSPIADAAPAVNYDIPAYQRNGTKPPPVRPEPTATPPALPTPGETPLPPTPPKPTATPEPLPVIGELPPAAPQKMASPLERYAAAPETSPYPSLSEPVLPSPTGAGSSALDQFARNPIEAQRRAVPDQFGDMLREAAPAVTEKSPLDAMLAGDDTGRAPVASTKSPLDEMLARDGASPVADQLTAGLRDTSDIDATLRQFGVEPPKVAEPTPPPAMELPPQPTPTPEAPSPVSPSPAPAPAVAPPAAAVPTPEIKSFIARKEPAAGVAERDANIQALRDIGLEDLRESAVSGDAARAAREFQHGRITSEPAGQLWFDQFQRETDAMKNYAQRLVDDTGGRTGLDESSLTRKGMDIAAPYDAARSYFEKAKQNLYAEADRQAAATGKPVGVEAMEKLLDDPDFKATLMAKDQQGLLSTIRSQYDRFRALEPDGLSVLNAEKFRKWLNKVWSPQSSETLGAVKAALDDDVFKSAGGDIYAAGRAMHQLEKRTLDNPNGISRLMDADPYTPINRNTPYERIPDKIMTLSEDQFKHIIDTYSDLPPELQPLAQQAIATLKAHYAERLINAGTETNRGNPRPLWDAGGVKKFTSDNSAKLPLVFDAAELDRISKMLHAGEVLRVNPLYPGAAAQLANASRAGLASNLLSRAGGGIGGTVGALAGGPVGAGVGGLLGEAATSKLLTSAAERRALAEAQAGLIRNFSEKQKPANPIEAWEAELRK